MTEVPKEINSRFKFVVVAAKRAVQLQRGARPKIATDSTKWTRVAIREVQAGLIKYYEPAVEEVAPAKPKGKSKKAKEAKEKD